MALKRENETLRQSILTMENLLNHLRNTPEDVARETLQRLRSAADINSVLPPVVLNQPSSSQVGASHLTSTMLSQHDIEKMTQHPAAYPASDEIFDGKSQSAQSIKRQKVDHSHRFEDDLPGASRTAEYDGPGSQPGYHATHSDADQLYLRPDLKTIFSNDYFKTLSPITGASLTSGYLDDRLQQVDASFWTLVPVTNEYVSGVISLYLATDHPLLGLFDADLFVGDLISGTQTYCSSFLVSSLLAFASVSLSCFSWSSVLIGSASLCVSRPVGLVKES